MIGYAMAAVRVYGRNVWISVYVEGPDTGRVESVFWNTSESDKSYAEHLATHFNVEVSEGWI